MGARPIQFLGQFPLSAPHKFSHCDGFVDGNRVICNPNCWRCFSGGRSGGSRWDWEKGVNPKQNFRRRDTYATDEFDEEGGFAFKNAAKQRIWWYDDFDEEEDEEDDVFGILEPAIGINWVFKVIQAFGWMIPIVVISMLLGTGPNAILMTLALPLAQSAFSFAAEALFGRPDEFPQPKRKGKKRPFAGRARVRRERKMHSERGKEAGSYKSWADASNISSKNGKSSPHNFGGWDELDNEARADKDTRVENTNQTRAQEEGKITRTKGNTPLFMRQLIAMFPFLGFWTKLL